MARKTVVTLHDDISGEVIDTKLVDKPTRSFSVDGVEYEIDLGIKNSAKFDKVLAEFITHARRVGGRKGARRSSVAPGQEEARAAREWAIEQGMDVPARGRVSQALIDEYRKAR